MARQWDLCLCLTCLSYPKSRRGTPNHTLLPSINTLLNNISRARAIPIRNPPYAETCGNVRGTDGDARGIPGGSAGRCAGLRERERERGAAAAWAVRAR
jgi:hypothetical protein